MKPSCYGHYMQSAWRAAINRELPTTFRCANPSTQWFNDLIKQTRVSQESKNKSSIACQRYLKGVARLGNKLNSTWTTRNVGHVNNKERKSRWYKFLILMVKLP